MIKLIRVLRPMRAILSFIIKSTNIKAVIETMDQFDINSKEVIETAKDREGKPSPAPLAKF